MTVPEENTATLRELERKIRVTATWRITNPAPYWYGQLLTSLLVAAAGEEIVHLQVDAIEDSKVLIAFTDSMLLRVRVSKDRHELDPLEVQCTPRSQLKELHVAAEESAYNPDSFSTWPGRLTYRLRYMGETEFIHVPADGYPEERERAASDALLPSLRRDLMTPA